MKSVYKSKQNRRTSFLILKVIFTFCILLVLYYQLKDRDLASWEIQGSSIFYLLFGILLVPLNWYFEFIKWKRCLKVVDSNVSKDVTLNSFYAGFITGFLTPSMSGNFIGRMYYFEREKRIAIVLLSLLSGLAQFIITLLAGMISVIAVGKLHGISEFESLKYLSWFAIPFSLFMYFFLEGFIKRFFQNKRSMMRLADVLSNNYQFRIELLMLSLIRYVVFTFQYVIILLAFGAEMTFGLWIGVAQLFLITTLIPSAFMGKLGIRESVGLVILGAIGTPEPVILLSSLSVWVMNLLLPTLFSLVIVKRFS